MKRIVLFFVLLSPVLCSASIIQPLRLPENPRILGMGGAYVAVADDPEAGPLNPSGLRTFNQVSYDLFYGSTTHLGPDQMGLALSNPGTERGTAFAMGIWTQGVTEHRRPVYYVPYTGSSFDLTSSTHLGLVLRFPYISSKDSTVDSGWKTIGDVTCLQTFESLRIGAALERAFGGSSNVIPRRLRLGGAFLSSSSGVIVSYEWQGDQAHKDFAFMRSSSHYGAEVPLGKYIFVRGGYVAGANHRVSMGLAIGTPNAGWRLEGGWELPAAVRGETRWALGLSYRI